MSDDETTDEDALHIDFTDQSQVDWRQAQEGYAPSKFFSDGTLHDKFVGRLSTDTAPPIETIRKRYGKYLADQVQYLADDWNLTCWTDESALIIAEHFLTEYTDEELLSHRGRFLAESTDEELWGQSRYQYVREKFGLKLLERVGPETFRQLIDVRPHSQFEDHYPDDEIGMTEMFAISKIDEVVVREILGIIGISEREFMKAALPFHSGLEAEELVYWSTNHITQYSNIQKLLADRWHNAIKFQTSLSVPQFIAAVSAALNQDGSRRTVREHLSDIHSQSPSQELSPGQLTDFISERSLLPDGTVDLLNQILRGVLQYESHEGSGAVTADAGETGKRETDAEKRSIGDQPTPTRIADADRAYTRLFLIRIAGKPTGITPQKITDAKLSELDTLEGIHQIKDTYTAYAAPASQQIAVRGMAPGDIVLFATEKSEYIGEYRIEEILIAPELVQDIWNGVDTEGDEQMTLPYLLLLSRPKKRNFPQQRLNQLLGYQATSTPSLWGVDQDRIDRLTDAGDSLEAILERLDQD